MADLLCTQKLSLDRGARIFQERLFEVCSGKSTNFTSGQQGIVMGYRFKRANGRVLFGATTNAYADGMRVVGAERVSVVEVDLAPILLTAGNRTIGV